MRLPNHLCIKHHLMSETSISKSLKPQSLNPNPPAWCRAAAAASKAARVLQRESVAHIRESAALVAEAERRAAAALATAQDCEAKACPTRRGLLNPKPFYIDFLPPACVPLFIASWRWRRGES